MQAAQADKSQFYPCDISADTGARQLQHSGLRGMEASSADG